MNFSDETLMTYADGELDAASRAVLEAAMAADPQLAQRVARHRALREHLGSDRPPGAAVRIGVSFRAGSGDYCRPFVLRQKGALAGLACRGHEVWRLEVGAQNPLPPAAAAAYRPAGSALPASVAGRLDELIAGEPLDAGAEAAARAGGWKR